MVGIFLDFGAYNLDYHVASAILEARCQRTYDLSLSIKVLEGAKHEHH